MRAEPTYPELHAAILVPRVLHGGFGGLGVLAQKHLDKGMALVLVDDARLDPAVLGKEQPKLTFRASVPFRRVSPAGNTTTNHVWIRQAAEGEMQKKNLRNTAYKQGAAVHLDRAVGHGAVHLDPLLPGVAVRRAARSATGRRALSVLGHAAAPAITIVVPTRTGTRGGRTPVVIEASVVGTRSTRGAAGSRVPAAGRRAGSRPPATPAGRSGAIVVAIPTSIITITRSIRSRHVPRAGARRGRRAWRDSIP